jgi:DNA-binding transcriptional regulator YhcF (GntR family)
VANAAEVTDTSLSTVYRVLQRMDGVLESNNGHVQFVSEAPRKEVRDISQSVEQAIESAADRAAGLVSMDLRQSTSSAFDKGIAKYGADVDWPEHDRDV